MITAADFKRMTNREPTDDDLDRCNCPDIGSLGHLSCGICKHDLPMFDCQPCSIVSHNQTYEDAQDVIEEMQNARLEISSK